MKRALAEFSFHDTLEWFRRHGVEFRTEEGGRIFPASQDSGEIVQTLSKALKGVDIRCKCKVESLPESDFTVVTTGGGPGMDILKNLPVETIPQVPSLFSFNISDRPEGGRSTLSGLSGLSLPAILSIPGTSFRTEGDLLITDWGLSGPAALRLSSYAARYLAECCYNSSLNIRWSLKNEGELGTELVTIKNDNPRKLLKSVHPEGIPARLWDYLISRAGLRDTQVWGELGQKGMNRLIGILLCDSYCIHGKTRLREEFVSCGGVSLSSINLKTLESRQCPGLYFAGEVLDVDAVTGGFNLQAAWSTSYMAAKSIIRKYDTQNL